jgi:hypothetical protein
MPEALTDKYSSSTRLMAMAYASCGAEQAVDARCHDRVPALRPPRVVGTREFDEPCAGDVRGDVAALIDVGVAILGAVHHDGWNPDRGQDVADVDLRKRRQPLEAEHEVGELPRQLDGETRPGT